MKVNRDSSTSPVRVCLLWRHPLALAELQRVLADDSFELLPARIDPLALSSLEGLLPAETSLYVIEGEKLGPETETIVTHVLAANPSARPIVMAEQFSELAAFSLLRLGTKGLVTYTEASERLARVLKEVDAGGFWVPRALLSRFVDETRASSLPRRPVGRTPNLTPREREILDDLLQNLSNKEIARKRRISARTAKFHVSNVLAKYGVKRRADLLLLSFPERSTFTRKLGTISSFASGRNLTQDHSNPRARLPRGLRPRDARAPRGLSREGIGDEHSDMDLRVPRPGKLLAAHLEFLAQLLARPEPRERDRHLLVGFQAASA